MPRLLCVFVFVFMCICGIVWCALLIVLRNADTFCKQYFNSVAQLDRNILRENNSKSKLASMDMLLDGKKVI